MEHLAYNYEHYPPVAGPLDLRQQLDVVPAAGSLIRKLAPYEPAPGAESALADAADHARSVVLASRMAVDLYWARESRPANAGGRLPTADLAATRTILTATVEVLNGRRSAGQVERYLSPNVLAAVKSQARDFSSTPQGLYLRSLHACQPAKGIIEACATIQRGKRFQALAARLESEQNGWICKLLRLM
jgi:hypothetical protein